MRAFELHCHAKQVQRSAGRSSVAAAAYRAGVSIEDERTGLTHDYTQKQGVEFSRIYTPENAPEWAKDRARLWNEVERKENRSNSATAHELEISFPHEFNAMQRREAADTIARELVSRYKCAVDVALHQPSKEGDQRNYHAHILFTTRGFDESTKDGWEKNKFRNLAADKALDADGNKTTRGQMEVLELRKITAQEMNRISERDGLDVQTHHLSFEARGIEREPSQKMGVEATALERKGRKTERGQINENIKAANDNRAELKQAAQVLDFEHEKQRRDIEKQIKAEHERIAAHEQKPARNEDHIQLCKDPLQDLRLWLDADLPNGGRNSAGSMVLAGSSARIGSVDRLRPLRGQEQAEETRTDTGRGITAPPSLGNNEEDLRLWFGRNHKHFAEYYDRYKNAKAEAQQAKDEHDKAGFWAGLTGKKASLAAELEAKNQNLREAQARLFELSEKQYREYAQAQENSGGALVDSAKGNQARANQEFTGESDRHAREAEELKRLESELANRSNLQKVLGAVTGRTKAQKAVIDQIKTRARDYEAKREAFIMQERERQDDHKQQTEKRLKQTIANDNRRIIIEAGEKGAAIAAKMEERKARKAAELAATQQQQTTREEGREMEKKEKAKLIDANPFTAPKARKETSREEWEEAGLSDLAERNAGAKEMEIKPAYDEAARAEQARQAEQAREAEYQAELAAERAYEQQLYEQQLTQEMEQGQSMEQGQDNGIDI